MKVAQSPYICVYHCTARFAESKDFGAQIFRPLPYSRKTATYLCICLSATHNWRVFFNSLTLKFRDRRSFDELNNDILFVRFDARWSYINWNFNAQCPRILTSDDVMCKWVAKTGVLQTCFVSCTHQNLFSCVVNPMLMFICVPCGIQTTVTDQFVSVVNSV